MLWPLRDAEWGLGLARFETAESLTLHVTCLFCGASFGVMTPRKYENVWSKIDFDGFSANIDYSVNENVFASSTDM